MSPKSQLILFFCNILRNDFCAKKVNIDALISPIQGSSLPSRQLGLRSSKKPILGTLRFNSAVISATSPLHHAAFDNHHQSLKFVVAHQNSLDIGSGNIVQQPLRAHRICLDDVGNV